MGSKKVSIIIAVYNSEMLVRRCLESVVNQTFKDIEIIVINDGSTDGSLQILKEYADAHPNIILLDQENAGYSTTLNRALDTVSGEYISFVDGDDYIEHDMIETLYNEATANDLDLVICNWDRVDQDGRFLSVNNHADFENEIMDRNELIREFFLNRKELIEGFTWNKLIKRSLIQEFNIRFPNTNYSDIPTIFKLLTKTKKAKYMNKPFYHYVQNNTSISHTKNEHNLKGFIRAVQMVHDILKEEHLLSKFEDAYFIYKSHSFFQEYSVYREALKNSKELSSFFEALLKPVTIKKCLSLKKQVDKKFLLKVFLYKAGLLRFLLNVYHGYKPI